MDSIKKQIEDAGEMPARDNVNPSYYADHAVAPTDLIREYNLNFALGNAVNCRVSEYLFTDYLKRAWTTI